MILQGNLQIKYGDEYFNLIVKTFLRNGIYYFFVRDKTREKSLLAGETLQVTYTGSFCNPEQEVVTRHPKIPADVVNAIEKTLLENKQLWIY